MSWRRVLTVFGYVLVLVLGLAGGFAVGMPGMVERAGAAAADRLGAKLGVALHADQVDWSFDGTVALVGLSVIDRAAPPDERAILAARHAVVESRVNVLGRRIRVNEVVLDGVEMRFARRDDGTTNVRGILDGLRAVFAAGDGGGAGAAGDAGGVLRYLERKIPTVKLRDLRLTIAPALGPLPLGIDIPPIVILQRGEVTVTPIGDEAHPGLEISARFGDSSLDPGQGFQVLALLDLDGTPRRLEATFDRPVRFYVGKRVAGIKRVAWRPDGLELERVMLSVPYDPEAFDPVIGAAATVERVEVTPEPRAILARWQAAAALDPDASVLALLGRAVDSVAVTGPAIMFQLRPDGSHNYVDLLGPLDLGGVSPRITAEALPGPLDDLTEATLSATARLINRDGAATLAAPLRRRLVTAFARLEDRLARGADRLTRVLSTFPLRALTIDGGHATVHYDGRALLLDELAISGSTGPDGVALRAELRAPELADHPAAFVLSVSPDGDMVKAKATLKSLPLTRVEAVLPRSVTPKASTELYDTTLSASWSRSARSGSVKGVLRVADLVVTHPDIAAAPLEGMNVQLQGTVTLDGQAGQLRIEDGVARLGDIATDVSVTIDALDRAPRIRADIDLKEVDCEAVAASLPAALIPDMSGLSLAGRMAWRVRVDLDTLDVDGLSIVSEPRARGFYVRSLGDRIDFEGLRRAHTYRIRRADGQPAIRTVGPLTSSWVPLAEISPWIVKAVTTTEDGSFYKHQGISDFAIRESVITNLKKGGFVRGGSTITQQLVKNLFLSGTKTISRKLQELFLAWQLEQALTKGEIMALYLNAIEFGPGIYGVGHAAAHYFGVSVAELTPLDAIFLSSIIPNPRRYHDEQFLPGRVTERWQNYLRVLLGVMVERNKLSPAERDAQAPFSPIFRGHGRSELKPLPDGYLPQQPAPLVDGPAPLVDGPAPPAPDPGGPDGGD